MKLAGGAEQVLKQGDENDEGESVEQRREKCRNQADPEQRPIGPDEPEQPALSLHSLTLSRGQQSYRQEHLLG